MPLFTTIKNQTTPLKAPLINTTHLNNYYRLAFYATLATLFLVFIGGLVRVSGAGMGCPDWPKCYGLWIPPITLSELPPAYDPVSFNPILTWVEYINRICGVVYGFLIFALLFQTVRLFRGKPSFLLLAISALLLTGFQGWIGKTVVATDLKPIVVSLHLILALIILIILVTLTHKAYHLKTPIVEEPKANHSRWTKRLSMILLLGAFGQVTLGTQVRETIEIAQKIFPLSKEIEWTHNLGSIGYFHAIMGICLILSTWGLGYYLLKRGASHFIETIIYILLALSWAQLIFGMSLIIVGIPPLVQLFHQWISAIYLATCSLLYLEIKHNIKNSFHG